MGLLDTYLMRFDEHGSLRMSTDRFAWVLLKQRPWCLDLLWSKAIQLGPKKKRKKKTWNINDIQKWRNVNTHTRSLIRTKHLYMSYVSYCYHFCYSVWQQLKRESVCVLLEQKSQTLLQRCLALWRRRTHVNVCTEQRSWSPISLPRLLFCSACLSSHAVEIF